MKDCSVLFHSSVMSMHYFVIYGPLRLRIDLMCLKLVQRESFDKTE